MELKRILARDSRSANEKAIQLYGSNVLIISSQRLDNQTELIVATDVEPSASESPKTLSAQADNDPQAKTRTPFVPFSQLLDEANARQDLDASGEGAAAISDSLNSAGTMDHKFARLSQTPVHQGSPSLTPGASLVSDHESRRSLEIVEMLRMEVASLRNEFSLSRQMRPWQDGLSLSPAMAQLVQAMNESGVPAALRALLTDSIHTLDSTEEAIGVMQNLLVTALDRPACELLPSAAHALCGPSGSGKTSMVARLAYAAAQKHGVERQAMVSFADHRPGAWAQMQLLASQAGVSCFRATDAAMLVTLLEDLQGKTVWIDTCGADFGAQAEFLRQHCPQVLRHAVLPVDATVTSVQKILDNSTASWTSLMLSKVDEAAHPWALLKGLTENRLPVSLMAGDSRICSPVQPFDPAQLVRLALAPMGPLLVKQPVAEQATPKTTTRPKRPVPVKKAPLAAAGEVAIPRSRSVPASKAKLPVADDIVIPTLMGAKSLARSRAPSKPSISA
jgi:flagellar biosynthesis protein FlhF